jgi:hypothetical protein
MTVSGCTGAFLVWKWGDRQIEDPRLLKCDLEAFQSDGVSGVLAVPSADLRYDLTDRRVIRAAAQAGQWARKRSIQFWFQADPRSASQSLIARTGERTQNLFILKDFASPFRFDNLCMAPVRNGRFEIRCVYRGEPREPEAFGSLLGFEPDGVEKAFAFRLHNGRVLSETVRDVSSEIRMFTDVRSGAVELFGSVVCDDDEEWRVMAFPRFDTRMADPGGRENNDAVIELVESFFDAGACFDGVTLDRGGYCGDPGRLPVSLSLFNSFIAEYGYDLRNRLLGLVFPFDDWSHVPVRLQYRLLLTEAIHGGLCDLRAGLHGFFGNVGTGLFHGWDVGGGTFQSVPDPWRILYPSATGFAALDAENGLRDPVDRLLGQMILTKGLGVFSSTRTALVRASLHADDPARIRYWTDLCALHSLRWIADGFDPDASGGTGRAAFSEANARIKAVEEWTGFRFPDAETLVLYPAQSLASAGPDEAAAVSDRLQRFVGRLAAAGVQMDAASSPLLLAGRLSPDGYRIGFRTYRAIVCPFPDVMEVEALERLQGLKRRNFPVIFAGSVPQVTTAGRPIPFAGEMGMDPERVDAGILQKLGLKPPLRVPEGSMGSIIRHAGEVLLLVCATAPGRTFGGTAVWEGREIPVPRGDGLSVFRVTPGREVEKVL